MPIGVHEKTSHRPAFPVMKDCPGGERSLLLLAEKRYWRQGGGWRRQRSKRERSMWWTPGSAAAAGQRASLRAGKVACGVEACKIGIISAAFLECSMQFRNSSMFVGVLDGY